MEAILSRERRVNLTFVKEKNNKTTVEFSGMVIPTYRHAYQYANVLIVFCDYGLILLLLKKKKNQNYNGIPGH